MTTYSVVGCRECDHLWIVENLRQQQTASCPQCGHARPTDKIKAQKQTEGWEEAAEYRGRLLAKRAGCLEEFVDGNDEFWIMEQRIQEAMSAVFETNDELVEEQLGIYDDKFGDLADSYLESDRVRNRSIYQHEVETYFAERFGIGSETHDEPDQSISPCKAHGPGSITPTPQSLADFDVVVALDGRPVTEISRSVTTHTGFRVKLASALRAAGDEVDEKLADAGVTALTASVIGSSDTSVVRELSRRAAAGDDGALDRLFELLPQLGTRTDVGIQSTTTDILTSYPRVFAALEETPTVAVALQDEFFDGLQTKQQRDIVRWLAELSQGCDVQVVGGPATLEKLRDRHHENLPTEFSERLKARRGNEDVTDEQVATARAELDPDGDKVQVLRRLDAEGGNNLEISQLVAEATVSHGRVSQRLGDLEALDLVKRYGTQGNRRVELSPVGRELIAALDADIGRQKDFAELFSEISPSSDEGVSSTRTRGDQGTSPGRHRTTAPHRLEWLARLEREVTVACAPENGVALVDHPVEPDPEDRNKPLADYDENRDLLLVGEEYDNPMSSMVTLANATTHPRVWGRTDLESRLADESTTFQDFFGDFDHTLRHSRCLGWFPDDVSSVADFLAELEDARDELLQMTRDLRNEEYDDRKRFRKAILRHALGLAGVMTHVFDLVDIEVLRYLRVPRFDDPDGFDEDDRDALAKRIAYQAAIESRYRQGAAFRSLLEDRKEKRDWGIFPSVDADDPFGQLIGRFVIAGPGMDEFEERLRQHISQPGGRDVVDDAPKFAVRIPIKTPDRDDYVAAMQPVTSRKNLSLSSEGTTIVRTLTGSPYDAARALNQLKPEDWHRDIRIDEVRVALAEYARRYSEQRILPETDPSVSKIVAALLRTKRTLSKSEIAEKADVANSTVSKHMPSSTEEEGEQSPLEALGLVIEAAGGYRLALTFATDEERGAHILPTAVDDDVTAAQDLVFNVVAAVVDDPSRLGDPEDPLYRAFQGFPPDLATLRDALPDVDPWVRVARHLCDSPDPGPVTVEFGAELEQTSLQAAAEGGDST